MPLKLYGWQHITYLLVTTLIFVTIIVLTKIYAKDKKTLTIVIKSMAALLLVAIIANRLSIVYKNDTPYYLGLLPSSFCGVSSLVLSLSVLFTKRDSAFLHFVVYIGFVGGFITLVYPDFIPQANSLFYFPTISGLFHHTVMVFLVLLMSVTGYFTPSIKKWYAVILGLTCYMTWGLFLTDILKVGAMTIGGDF